MPTDLLLVDDDADIRRVFELLLGRKLSVAAAATGAAALDEIRARRPKLVLLDLSLPDMDGLEVLRRAKEIDPMLSVVVLTGAVEDAKTQAALDAGAAKVLTKPMDWDRLEAELRILLSLSSTRA